MLWLIAVAGCLNAVEESKAVEEEEVLDAMSEHWAEAEQLREAVIVGNLEEYRRLAKQFDARLPVAGVPKDLEPIGVKLKQAVGSGTEVPDLATAGTLVGQMTAACGGCHLRAKVRPDLPSKVHPTTGSDPSLEMVWHHIGAANLWAAVVQHDDKAFDAALDQVAKATFDADPGTAPSDALQALEDRVQDLARTAREVKTIDERGEKLGAILGTCAACHEAAGVTFE